MSNEKKKATVHYTVKIHADGTREDVARSATVADASKHRDDLVKAAPGDTFEIEEREGEPHPAWIVPSNGGV